MSFNVTVNSHSNGVNTTIEFILEVHSVSPLLGSLMGGTRLTITGSGFSNVTAHNQVFFGSSHGKTQTPVVPRPGGISPKTCICTTFFASFMDGAPKGERMFMHIRPSLILLYQTIRLDSLC